MNNGNGNGYHLAPQFPTKRDNLWKDSAPDSVQPVKVTSVEMLNEVWPYVRPRLERIKKKDKAAGNWVPEHVRLAIVQGMAKPPTSMVELFVGLDPEGNIHGFIVTVVRVDYYLNLPWTLYIWCGWLNRKLIKQLTPWLEKLARERGLTGIEFESGRFGWMGSIRKLMNAGFYCKHYTYRKEVRL